MKIYIYNKNEYKSLTELRHNNPFLIFPNTFSLDNFKEIGIEVKEQIIKPSQDELNKRQLQEAKVKRAEAVANIKVTVDRMIFDGDEISQTRMVRSIVGLNDGESILWVLADNTPVQVTKEQLKQALRLAGEEQTKVWATPYETNQEDEPTTIHL